MSSFHHTYFDRFSSDHLNKASNNHMVFTLLGMVEDISMTLPSGCLHENRKNRKYTP